MAFPEGVTVSSDGRTLYTVAQGSGKLAIYATADLENGTVVPSAAGQVLLSGGGPTGLAVNDTTGMAFVLTRFDNSISTVNLAARREIAKVTMFNPEPASITNGRKFLYDATLTSTSGTRPAPAATSAATRTSWRGTSATPAASR